MGVGGGGRGVERIDSFTLEPRKGQRRKAHENDWEREK